MCPMLLDSSVGRAPDCQKAAFSGNANRKLVKFGEPLTCNDEGNAEPSLGRNIFEGVETRRRGSKVLLKTLWSWHSPESDESRTNP